MTSDKRLYRLLERGHIQISTQPNRTGHVVDRITRLKLIKEPQPLLRIRGWKDENV